MKKEMQTHIGLNGQKIQCENIQPTILKSNVTEYTVFGYILFMPEVNVHYSFEILEFWNLLNSDIKLKS